MSSLLLYRQIVPLDHERHGKLRLSPPASLAFAANAPVVPLLTTEFVDAAREYPIAFLRGGDQALLSVALTGAADGSNVYVDAAGHWQARYVPAYVRRHPFVFAESAPDQFAVCIDEASPTLGESEGEALFDGAGAPSAMLQQVIGRLGEYQRQASITQGFMQRLDASGLLMEASAQADLDGRQLALKGFQIVDEARFHALPQATLVEWFASGELGLIYAHLFSLGNVLELLRRMPRESALAALPPSPRTPRAKRSTAPVVAH